MEHNLLNPEFLKIICPDGKTATGGSQKWYPERWERAAGCGPTAASNIIWYMARSQPELRDLCDIGDGDYTRFLALMREVFPCFNPGFRGINSSALFVNGVKRYASARGVDMIPHVLEIPASRRKRQGIGAVGDFITDAIRSDAPVAFLCLSRGKLSALESWHWVTIMSYNKDMSSAMIANYGSEFEIDITEWRETSVLGGCFVHFSGTQH